MFVARSYCNNIRVCGITLWQEHARRGNFFCNILVLVMKNRYHKRTNGCGEKLLRQCKNFVAIVYFNKTDFVAPSLYLSVHTGHGDKLLQ
jgi:hypothetical protein